MMASTPTGQSTRLFQHTFAPSSRQKHSFLVTLEPQKQDWWQTWILQHKMWGLSTIFCLRGLLPLYETCRSGRWSSATERQAAAAGTLLVNRHQTPALLTQGAQPRGCQFVSQLDRKKITSSPCYCQLKILFLNWIFPRNSGKTNNPETSLLNIGRKNQNAFFSILLLQRYGVILIPFCVLK